MGLFTSTPKVAGPEPELHQFKIKFDGYYKIGQELCKSICTGNNITDRDNPISYFNFFEYDEKDESKRTAYQCVIEIVDKKKMNVSVKQLGSSDTKVLKFTGSDDQYNNLCEPNGRCPGKFDYRKINRVMDTLGLFGSTEGTFYDFWPGRIVYKIMYKDNTVWYAPHNKSSKFGQTRVSANSSKSTSADIKYLRSIK